MTTVSILIPAHRAQFLDQAIASALAQTFDDIEILVGDNTPDGALKRVVQQFDSPKLKYFHHGFDTGAQNALALWERAAGKYVKWLYYDDLLAPNSVEVLVAALIAFPQSIMAFHQRVFINEKGDVVHTPGLLLPEGHAGLLDRNQLVRTMLPELNNYVGEPSFIMHDKARTDVSKLGVYRSRRFDFLGDVCTYLAVAEVGPIVVVGGYLGRFRRHGAQASAAESPSLNMGIVEWEELVRGEAAAGNLSVNDIVQCRQRLANLYGHFVGRLPELQRFVDGLSELTDGPTAQLADSEFFRANLAYAQALAAERAAAADIATMP